MDPNVESRISDGLSALHAHLQGRRPSAARTYIAGDDVVVVVLEETFTPAEQALVDRGEAEGIQELRRRLRRVMADDIGVIVEQATGSTEIMLSRRRGRAPTAARIRWRRSAWRWSGLRGAWTARPARGRPSMAACVVLSGAEGASAAWWCLPGSCWLVSARPAWW
jgi:uncharacterized protein YbcI